MESPANIIGAVLSKMGEVRQNRLSVLGWLTVSTLSFFPAAYYLREFKCLVYVLAAVPLLAFLVTLSIAWSWAIWKPHLLRSEDIDKLAMLLENGRLAPSDLGVTQVADPLSNPNAAAPVGPNPAEKK